VTATEAERNRRRGLTSWWRGRSWGTDLDTLARLHRALQALDADDHAEQAPRCAPPLLERSAAPDLAVLQDGPVPQDGVPQDGVPRTDWPGFAPEPDGLELRAVADLAWYPEAPPDPAPAPEDEHGGTEPGLLDAVTEPAAGGADPAIAAVRETFRYVADAGDKAVGFFYGQLFLRRPQLRQLFPPAMDEQRDRLFRALGRIVESLSTPDEMAAYLGQLGRDHRKYRVEPEMYEAVGAALLATLRAFARDAFTSEAEAA